MNPDLAGMRPALDASAWLVVGWLAYFGLHSLMASLWLKHWVARRLPRFMPAYRLLYNAVAILALLPLLWVTYALDSPMLWRWSGALGWLANGIALCAVAGFFWTLRYYDGAEFLGIRQWRDRSHTVQDRESLRISPAHRVVRHPWYALALSIIWTRDMNMPWLISFAAITLYFVFGSRLEERKLIRQYGDVYERYRERVPGLIPRPWRFLTRREADQLLRGLSANGSQVERHDGPG
jgi:protein-S-isoprenylcysteine O-methyltransferase Ste14